MTKVTAAPDRELNEMLRELAEVTGECRAARYLTEPCSGPPGRMICIADPYLPLRTDDLGELHREGRLWLGCE